MKNKLMIALIGGVVLLLTIFVLVVLTVSSCFDSSAPGPPANSMAQTAARASSDIPIPVISFFQERRTIAKWAERWDKPSLPTYVYLVSFGKILGYYVADGKPASTRSYLFPEEKLANSSNSESSVLSTQDLDGTYGTNNPGIRFFTAAGTAVEWGGDGASYIYSDAPLAVDAPLLEIRSK